MTLHKTRKTLKSMKYIHTYKSYKSEKVNEELLSDVFKSAKGAFKNFLNGLMIPFKNLKDDFKKGLKIEEVRTKMNAALDNMLKNSAANIQQCKDESELNQISDAFLREIDEKITEFDKEIKTVKESMINESVGQDALITGRVLFSFIKDEYNKSKQTYDKKFADAKNLETKKNITFQRLKSIVDFYKKRISDENIITQSIEKYKQENKISSADNNILKSYGVKKTEELVGKEVSYKKDEFNPADNEEKQAEMTANGEVKSVIKNQITIFNKNINQEITKDIKDLLPHKDSSVNDIKDQLGKIKDDTSKMKKIGAILPKIIDNLDKPEKLKAAEDALL